MKCSNCNNEIKTNDKFCKECGCKINKRNVSDNSIIFGIFAILTFFIPVISIPLAIIGISCANSYIRETGNKSGGKALNIISLIFSIITTVFVVLLVVFAVNLFKSDKFNQIIDRIDNNIINNAEKIDIKGKTFITDNNEIITFDDNNQFIWYKTKGETLIEEDNIQGVYMQYSGKDAVDYITEKLNMNKYIYEIFDNKIQQYNLIILEYDDKKEYLFGTYQDNKMELKNVTTDEEIILTIKEVIEENL